MHTQLFSVFLHHSIPLPTVILPLSCPAARKELMHEHLFSAFLHQFSDFYPRSELDSGRVHMKSDARKALAGLRASLHIIIIHKRKELTTNTSSSPVRRQF